MSFGVVWTGLDTFGAALSADLDKKRKGLASGLYKGAVKIMNASQRIAPVGGPPTSKYDKHPRTLVASGTVLLPQASGDSVSVTLGYGGAASAYAHRQHEEIGWHHKPGQQAKYLEQPLMEGANDIRDEIVNAINSGGS